MTNQKVFDAMRVYVATVEAGSFTAAGARLGLSKQRVSRLLMALEAHLGVQLLTRSTRRLRITDLGQEYYRRARDIIAAVAEAEAVVSRRDERLQGTLRVSAPMSFGIRHLGALVGDFLLQHSGAQIQLDLNDRAVDLLAEGYDMAVRIGMLADSSLVARRLVDVTMVAACSPAYAARHGVPKVLAELRDHACLCYAHTPGVVEWRFAPADARDGAKSTGVRVQGPLHANNGEVIRDAAIAGLGIALLPDFIHGDALAAARLIPVLPAWRPLPSAVYALYPQHRESSRLMRAFIEHLRAGLARGRPGAGLTPS